MAQSQAHKKARVSTVLQVRKLTEATSVIRFERDGLHFNPGQRLRIGTEGSLDIRDYSIYSGQHEDFFEILVRRIDGGVVSKQLLRTERGDRISIEGPYGTFALPDCIGSTPLLLVATGTGISPYHSYVASYPNLNYRLIHGTAKIDEAYDREFYGRSYFHCVSREPGADFHGRLTSYLDTLRLDTDAHVFLCGNCNMIYDSRDMLLKKGLPYSQIHSEIYFLE